tara:strand:- start:666 stop:1163 length:498 start_codon:yes stop_codon:yes gene_type:complete
MISQHHPKAGRLFVEHPFDLKSWSIPTSLSMNCYELQLKGTRQKDSYFTISILQCELGHALDAFDSFPDFPGCKLRIRDNFGNILAERGMLFSKAAVSTFGASPAERLEFLLSESPVQRELVKANKTSRCVVVKRTKQVELPRFSAHQLKQVAKQTLNQLRSFVK